MLALAACGLSSVAMAGGLPVDVPAGSPATSDAGIYLGLGAGYGMNSIANEKINGVKQASFGKTKGFMGRAFLGYDINRYFAVEAGYSHFFTKPEIRELDDDYIGNASNGRVYKMKRTHVVDLMGKIKAPVCDGFDIYGKLGANYFMSGKNSFNIAYGAGLDWNVTNNVVAGLEWLRFNGNKDDRMEYTTDDATGQRRVKKVDVVKHSDAFMVTLRYKFDI